MAAGNSVTDRGFVEMQLPFFQTAIQELSLLQTKWKSILDPVISQASVQSIILPNVPLKNGTTVVNHLLGRKLVGWKVIRQRASASIYDTQDSNQTPNLTLVLVSSAAVSVDLEVF
jgi:hypothetical protein